MDLAAHQCVVDPSAKQLRGKKAYAIMAANDFGTRTWWGYEKRLRDVGSTTREHERVGPAAHISGIQMMHIQVLSVVNNIFFRYGQNIFC